MLIDVALILYPKVPAIHLIDLPDNTPSKIPLKHCQHIQATEQGRNEFHAPTIWQAYEQRARG